MKKCLIVSTVSRQFTLFEKGNIETLKKLGYEIHCAANYSDATEELDKLPIIRHSIDIQRSPFSLKNIKAYKQLKKIVNKENFELIHCHTPMGGVLARLVARQKRITNKTNVIYTAHGFHFYKGAPLINWMIYYPIEKWLSKYTDCIITINREDYDIASKKFKARRIELVNGIGIDSEKFNFEMTDKERHELRESLNLNDDDFILTEVGELNKNKNQIMSITAMKGLIKEKPNIHLLLVGKGKLEDFYKQKITEYCLQKNVHLLGYRKDVPQLLKISNALLSLSHREGLPVNVMEAMFSKLPAIVTDCRGNRDLVQNEINGYIVNINNINELNNAILNIYNNEKILKNNLNVDKYLKENVKKEMKNIYVNI